MDPNRSSKIKKEAYQHQQLDAVNGPAKKPGQMAPDIIFPEPQAPAVKSQTLFAEDQKGHTIIITVCDSFSVKAFRFSETDPVPTPLTGRDLIECIRQTIQPRHAMPPGSERSSKLRAALADKISIPTSAGNEFIPVNEILRIKAEGSYSNIFFEDRKPMLVSRSLRELEQALDGETFFRAHKSHLVNLRHVTRFSPVKDGGFLQFRDGSRIEIARSQKSALSLLFSCYLR